MELKQLRKEKRLTQEECASYLGIPLRTYKNYENDENKRQSVKYRYMFEKLERYGYVDETHGILPVENITQTCKDVFVNYPVEYCYLFGSYAKKSATENSDVDLLVSTSLSGLKYYGLVEELRTRLKKKTDVINLKQLENNAKLLDEILKDGIKIYG